MISPIFWSGLRIGKQLCQRSHSSRHRRLNNQPKLGLIERVWELAPNKQQAWCGSPYPLLAGLFPASRKPCLRELIRAKSHRYTTSDIAHACSGHFEPVVSKIPFVNKVVITCKKGGDNPAFFALPRFYAASAPPLSVDGSIPWRDCFHASNSRRPSSLSKNERIAG